MPVATSSRRRRRQPTEDIEDAAPSQTRGEELDEEEEQVPPRRTNGAKKGKERAEPTEDAEAEEIDDPLANFVNHPVDKAHARNIAGLAEDWAQAKKAYHQSSYSLVRDIASSVAEFTEGEKGEKVSSLLDIVTSEVISNALFRTLQKSIR